ncbi:MAG: alanine:cation symporter family protein, partial [Lachnospiraceae bacterium]|nr:alanine:cation symporter family protein [Lachnospiraceae bacterium]
ASLCTSLAATIGTGSIVGVATALRIGGPGALFWMWVSALLGMGTKYAESVLAVKYRTRDENGHYAGGPMYYIQNGMGKKWIPLAKAFAVFGLITALLGCGTFPQVNAITESMNSLFHIPTWVSGLVIALLSGAVILGGIKSISKVAEFVVPIMAVFYIGGAIAVLGINIETIPAVFSEIFSAAFKPASVAGGVTGTVVVSVMTSMRTGIARGIYTNEAGLGSSPIVSASAMTNSCVRQGLISMTGVFFTTIVVCTMTGMVILSSGLLETSTLDGSVLASRAFSISLPGNIGEYIVTIGIVFFSFTTIIGWCYYGERCAVYLTGGTKVITGYKSVYILMLVIAPFLALDAIWTLADITNALMVFPNLIALLALRKDVVVETKQFWKEEKDKKLKNS